MTSTKKTNRVYKGRQAIDFIMANPNKRLSIEAISEGVGGWTPASISGLCGKLIKEYPDNMKRVGAGVYMWNQQPGPSDPRPTLGRGPANDLLVTILQRKDDGTMLVRAIESQTVYVMRELDF